MRIGEISATMEDYKEALLAFKTAVQITDDPQLRTQAEEGVAMTISAKAMEMLAKEDYKGAGELWTQLETLQKYPAANGGGAAIPEAYQAKVMLGRAMAAELQGKAEQAAKIFSDLTSQMPNRPEAVLAKARLADLEKPLMP